MLSDDSGERTQPPTERRRREARSRGQVARSANLVAAIVLLAVAIGAWSFARPLIAEIAGILRNSLSSMPPQTIDQQYVADRFTLTVRQIGMAMIPFLVMTVVSACIANLVQTGFLWVPTAVLPQTDRINPAKQLERSLSVSSWMGFGGAVIKVAVLLVVLVLFVRSRLASSIPLSEGHPGEMLDAILRLVTELGILLSGSLLVMAVIDYGYQYWKHEQSLMMTVEEVRREQREENGDPRLKQRPSELAKAG